MNFETDLGAGWSTSLIIIKRFKPIPCKRDIERDQVQSPPISKYCDDCSLPINILYQLWLGLERIYSPTRCQFDFQSKSRPQYQLAYYGELVSVIAGFDVKISDNFG